MTRNLILVLGDQLNADSAAFDDFDPKKDRVWMAEVREESTRAWCHRARITIYLSAMRHFAEGLRKRGIRVDYRKLEDSENLGTFAAELADAVKRLKPARIIAVQPGEWRVQETLKGQGVELREDRHFFCTAEEFSAWAADKKQLRMEFFYRKMRARFGYLMEKDKPVGGDWNYDSENRKTFGKQGPPKTNWLPAFPPDQITRDVLALVEKQFPDHPGSLARFDYPVTPSDADKALEAFITHALPSFGDYQDAMWTGEETLFHSRISPAMNLKLIDPRKVVGAAEQAFHDGHVPLAAAEGFIRQILGWREYVRGVYWMHMPEYLERNHLKATAPLPEFYWTGDTDMACLRAAITQTLETGYAHHIQRLMVTGLFSLLLGVDPKAVHLWYLAVYVDAVEWVELPNTLGMSQYGDGGVMASKPYIASGKYIQRMSNYCTGCRYDPAESTGENACPFTTLYWDFLMRHEKLLAGNVRMSMQLRNAARLADPKKKEIHVQANEIRSRLTP